MNDEQLHAAIYNLMETEQLILPYNTLPGSMPGGLIEGVGQHEASWSAYIWNPPQFLSYLPEFTKIDPNASDKPAYTKLVIASGQGKFMDLKRYTLSLAREEAQRRIVLAYEASSFNDEVMMRLRKESTAAQDTERDRLRTLYSELKTAINIADEDFILSLDVTSDSLWAAN